MIRSNAMRIGRWLGGVVALLLLFATGMVAGDALAHNPEGIVAQEDPGIDDGSGDGSSEEGGARAYCEHDACVKIKRRFWFDNWDCAPSPDSWLNCDELVGSGQTCRNYRCQSG